MSYNDPDRFFEKLKKNPVLKMFYKLPAADWIYQTALGFVGAVYYGFPSRRIKVIGITGTKGKTTATDILHALLSASGAKTALLSSARIAIGSESEKNSKGNSMPGRMYIQSFLRRAADAGCKYAVLEVTSQGVLLSRHRFIRWAAGGITNVQPEHLEAHGSFENYRASKLAFLKAAASDSRVFVNAEDPNADFFRATLPQKRTAFYSKSDLPKLPPQVQDVLPGKFNLENIALAISIARFFNITEEAIWGGLENFKGVAGRAEFIQRHPFIAVVDYAHTPDSLKAIYEAIRPMVTGNIIAVLGAAGGGRDKWKRPEMGKMAAQYAGEIILTDEDPYDEDPASILKEISKGFFPNTVYSEILNREEAIKEAVKRAKPGDAVVITGKGSEQFIHLAKGKVIPWSDAEYVRSALRK